MKEKSPLMYNGWEIRRKKLAGNKYCAYNYRTNIFINPIYKTWEQLKLVIDAIKD